MNNARADMFHDLVCEHRKLSDAHSKLRLELSQKGNFSRHTKICRIPFSFYSGIFLYPTHNFSRHSAAGAEAQVTALLQRVKELNGMPVSADLFYYSICTSNPLTLAIVSYLKISLNFQSL
jgi:hypothetical protein